MALDLDADPVEARSLIFFQLLEFNRGKENRMRIECKEHSLNCRLGRFFVIDLAGIIIFYGRDGLAIIALDPIGFKFLSGRDRGVRTNDGNPMPSRARAKTSGHACRHDYQPSYHPELTIHK